MSRNKSLGNECPSAKILDLKKIDKFTSEPLKNKHMYIEPNKERLGLKIPKS